MEEADLAEDEEADLEVSVEEVPAVEEVPVRGNIFTWMIFKN